MMRAKHLVLLLIGVVCFSAVNAAAAESTKEGTTIYSLGEVVVSSDAPETATSLEVTADDIEKKNARTLDEALELLPGVDVTVGAAGTPRVNIRGFRSRHTILLLNGIPINSTYDGQFNSGIVAAEHIAKIKVSYGTHSVLYGQGGLAGVINIITKQGTQGLSGEASAEMDERGNHYSKLSAAGGKEKINFFASLSNLDSDGFLLPENFDSTSLEDGGIRENTDSERLSFFGNLAFQPRDDMAFGLTVEHSQGEFGIPPTIVDDRNDPFYKSAKYQRTDDFETFSTQASMSWDPTKRLGFRAWVFTNNSEEDNARYDDDTYSTITSRNSYETTDETSIWGGTLQTSLNFDARGSLVMSLSGEEDSYESNGYEITRSGTETIDLDQDLNIYSAGLEYKVAPVDRLDITLGYSHHWQDKDEGSDDDAGSYMAGASFKVVDGTTLRASYARKVRFPSIRQLYDPDDGNDSLTTEQSDNWEAGIAQQLPWHTLLDLSFFLSDVEDYIEKDDNTDLFENNEAYEFKGIQVSLARPILADGNVRVGYTYMESEDKSSDSQKDELQYRPRHKLTVDAYYTWGFGLTAYADFMHVADQVFYSSSYDQGSLKDYSVVNLRLEQTVYKEMVSVYAGIRNLFDEYYEESYGYPREGRTAYAGLRMRF